MRAKVEDLYIPTHDGTILIVRRVWGGRGKAVLVLPSEGEHISGAFYDDLGHAIADRNTTAYLLELRGHGISEGRWSLEEHRRDIDHVIEMLHKAFHEVYVIAQGLSASLMLEREHTGQAINGMLLIAPRFEHKKGKQEYRLQPVRVQTPTIIFTSAHNDALRRIFGPVRIRAGWAEAASQVEHMRCVHTIRDSLRELEREERPIRFPK
jgi:alpha-beta hydrolase superfamily lysophospholipase